MWTKDDMRQMRSSVHIGMEFTVINQNLLTERKAPRTETVRVVQVYRDYVLVTNGRYQWGMCWVDLFGTKDEDDK